MMTGVISAKNALVNAFHTSFAFARFFGTMPMRLACRLQYTMKPIPIRMPGTMPDMNSRLMGIFVALA